MERFGISRVFGLHNMPGLPVGKFALRPGPLMASTAEFTITVRGKGGHAAMPHRTTDPIVIIGVACQRDGTTSLPGAWDHFGSAVTGRG